MANEAPIHLFYWDIRGSAQPIRHLMEYLHIPYNETHYTDPHKWYKQDMEKVGRKCLFPILPYVVDDNFYITQPISISKYICASHKADDMLGKTLQQQGKIDQILAKYVIFNNKLAMLFKPQMLKGPNAKQRLDRLFNQIMSLQYFPFVIEQFKTSKWLFDVLTIADFFTYESIFYLTGIYGDKLQAHPQLLRFMRDFEDIQEIKNYNVSDRLITKTFMGQIGDHWKGDPKFSSKPNNN